jgi:hypothetical protein
MANRKILSGIDEESSRLEPVPKGGQVGVCPGQSCSHLVQS